MNKRFVNYDIAALAKSKGYDAPSMGYYWDKNYYKKKTFNNSVTLTPLGDNDYNCTLNRVSGPMYQDLIDWFYDKHEIDICTYYITPFEGGRVSVVTITNFKTFKDRHDTVYVDHGIPDKPVNHWENKYEGLSKAFEEAFKLI